MQAQSPPTAGWPIYFRYAAFSMGHVLVLSCFVIAIIASEAMSGVWRTLVAVLTALAVDAMMVLAVSRCRLFRRKVGRRLAAIARAQAASQRAALLSRMQARHREELLHLESVVDALRARLEAREGGGAHVGPMLEYCGALIATYVRLAIRHGRAVSALASVDAEQLGAAIVALEHPSAFVPDVARPHLEARLAVCRERVRQYVRTRERVRALDDQLALIAERIQLALEDSSAVRLRDNDSERVRVAAFEEDELELIRIDETDVEPELLALGRERTGAAR